MMRLAALVMLPCAIAWASPPPEVKKHYDWGEVEEVVQEGRFYVSSAPDETALKRFADERGAAVVDLRTGKEMDCGLRTIGVKMGLKYHNLPYDQKTPITPELVAGVEKAIAEAGDGPVLFLCQTGNRAAALLAIHLAQAEKLDRATAVKRAKSLGLKAKAMEAKLQAYLSR